MSSDIETNDLDDDGSIDERPQRRREWSGPLRSIVLPVVVVAAIVGVIWAIEQGDNGGSLPEGVDGGAGIVELPAGLTSDVGVAAEKGKLAPDFVLPTVDGGSVRLSDFAGRPVFVNFWATWCGPCRREMPEIIEANDRYANRGLAVIAVNLQEDRGTVAAFVDEFGMDFPTALDYSGEVGAAYRVWGLPTSYFIDREGIIRAVFFGPLSADELDRQLRKIL